MFIHFFFKNKKKKTVTPNLNITYFLKELWKLKKLIVAWDSIKFINKHESLISLNLLCIIKIKYYNPCCIKNNLMLI